MKKLAKKVVTGILAASMVLSSVGVSYASDSYWRQDGKGWWLERIDGSYLTNQWYQSPASGLWYYMGADGYMLISTTTPDGYTVNADGVWVQNQSSAQSQTNAQKRGSETDNLIIETFKKKLGNVGTQEIAFIDLNEDSIPEMVYKSSETSAGTATYKVCMYKFGEAVDIGSFSVTKNAGLKSTKLYGNSELDTVYIVNEYIDGETLDGVGLGFDSSIIFKKAYSLVYHGGKLTKAVFNFGDIPSPLLDAVQIKMIKYKNENKGCADEDIYEEYKYLLDGVYLNTYSTVEAAYDAR